MEPDNINGYENAVDLIMKLLQAHDSYQESVVNRTKGAGKGMNPTMNFDIQSVIRDLDYKLPGKTSGLTAKSILLKSI